MAMNDTQQSLDALQNALNFVLIEVGKAFKKSKRNGKAASHPYARIQTDIPNIEERYHCSLDDIEEEIIRAKAILIRDIEQIQAKRIAAEPPKPEPVLTPEKPSETIPEDIPSAPISFAAEVRGPVSQFGGHGASEPRPETTLDRLQKSIGEAQKIVKSPNSTGMEVQAAKGADDSSKETPALSGQILPNELLFESPTDSKDQTEKPSTGGPKDSESNSKEQPVIDNTQGTELSKSNTVAVDAQAISTDIDSLFKDDSSLNVNQNDTLDFADIDFTAGDDFTFAENTTSQNNTGLDSLMPGIESYAAVNQADDFNMLDFPSNSDAAKDNKNANTDATIDSLFDFREDTNTGSGNLGGNSANDVDLGMSAESNFEDLLDGMDFGDADDGTGGGGMEHGEFDDAFFGLS